MKEYSEFFLSLMEGN